MAANTENEIMKCAIRSTVWCKHELALEIEVP
jgi:hypothetical protein